MSFLSNFAAFEDPFGVFGTGGWGKLAGELSSGKKSKPPAPPPFEGASSTFNGQPSGNLYQNSNQYYNQFLPSTEQQSQLNASNAGIASILPQLGTQDPAMQQNYMDMANANAQNQVNQFNSMMAPQMRSLNEQYASQYGTTKNTPYIDAMGQVYQNYFNPQYENIASNAYNTGLNNYATGVTNNANALNALQGNVQNIQNFGQNQMLNNLQGAAQGNQFNQNAYQAQMAAYMNAQKLAGQQSAAATKAFSL